MRKLKLFFACLLMAVLNIGQVWADTYTLGWGSASGSNSTNFTATSGSVSGVVSFTTDKNSSQNDPAYNSNNKDLRLYYNSGGNGGSITLTPATGVTITGFVMTTSTTPFVKYTVDGGSATSVSASNSTYTVTGISASSSLKIQNVNTSNTQLRIKTIQITYTPSQTPAPTLSSLEISGDLTDKSYETGEELDFSGLTVTGTYSDSNTDDVTNDVEWSFSPALAVGTSTYTVTATIGEISDSKEITGVTVTEHVVTPGTYPISLNNALYGTTENSNITVASVSATQDDITVVTGATQGTKPYTGTTAIRYYTDNYLTLSVPSGYNITAVAFAEPSSSTTWNGSITVNVGTYTADSKSWEGKSNSVTFSFGAQNRIATATVTYESVAPEVTVDPSSLSFTAKQNITVNGKTFTLTGANLTSGLTLAASSEAFVVSPTSLTKAEAEAGATITVTPATPTATTTPVEGTVTISGGGLASNVVVNLSMAVTETYAVEVAVNDNNMGSATINGGTAIVYAEYADDVNLVATPESGYEFVSWSASSDDIEIANATSATTTAAIGAAGTITATFQAQACTGLAAPTLDEITKDYQSATIAWNAVTNAEGYVLNITKHEDGSAVLTNELIVAPYVSYEIASGLAANTQYDYAVMAIGDGQTYCDENNALLSSSFTTEEYPAATLTFNEVGGTAYVLTGTHKLNDVVTLPDELKYSGCSGKVFVGWSSEAIAESVDDEPESNYWAKGATDYTIDATDDQLYAVYATVSGGEDETYNFASFTSAQDVTISDPTNFTIELHKGNASNNPAWNNNASEARIYAKGNLKVKSTSPITKIVFTYNVNANNSGVKPTIDGVAGKTNAGTWNAETKTWTGNDTEVTFSTSGSAGNVGFTKVVVTTGEETISDYTTSCSAALPVLDDPTFTVGAGEYAEGQNVELEAATGATIYYVINEEEITEQNRQTYSGAISLSNRGSYTILAYAEKDGYENSEVVSATYKINPPFATVADFFTYLGDNTTYNLGQVTITGIVSEIVTPWGTNNYQNITFNITDDGQTSSTFLQAFRCSGVKNGEEFIEGNKIAVGDKVTLVGNYTYFTSSSTHELAQGNYITSRPNVVKSIALSNDGTDYPTTFEQGAEFSHDHMVVTATYNKADAANVTTEATWDGYDMDNSGNQTVTVHYTYEGKEVTATYTIQVNAPSTCTNKIIITKGAENSEEGTYTLSVSGEQCLDDVPGQVISTTLTAVPAEHYTFTGVTSLDGETVVGVVGEIIENSCTITGINASTTITAIFAEDDKVTVKFAMGTENATGDVPADEEGKYAGQKVTLPANPFTYTGDPMKAFGGWKHSVTNEVKQPGEYVVTADDAALDEITFTAVWNDLSVWATTYTSNVTVGTDVVKFSADENAPTYDAKKTGTGSAAGSTTVTVPAGTTKLHFHAAGWNNESVTLAVKKGETEIQSFAIPKDAGMHDNSPFTLANNPATTEYFAVTLSGITEATQITFAATSGKRFAIYGVNAEYPAAITLNPATYDFENVLNGGQATHEFTITPNEMVSGDFVASIIDASAENVFSVGAISNNKVTVTFAPNAEATFTAKLKVACDNAEITADLSGTGIPATTPEITVNTTAVSFGTIVQDENAGTQTVNVTLANIDENGVSASISGTVFSLNTNNLTANGQIVISANTATAGTYEETLTLLAEGAEDKTITVTMTVGSKWAYTYTSNVTVGTDKVVIGGTQYEAKKAGGGSSYGTTTVEVPAYTETLHFHAAGWGADNVVNLDVKNGSTVIGTFALAKDAGVKSNSPYTLDGTPSEQYYSVTLSGITQATEITFEANNNGGYRFVIYGVNQEGGLLPVLDHIAISGTMTNTTGWKEDDEITPEGLTVMATSTLAEVEQTPEDVTADVVWSHNPLTAGQTEVTLTATYEGKTATIDVTLTEAVASADPLFTVNPEGAIAFGTVEQNETVPAKFIDVTLRNIASASVILSGEGASAFIINKAAMTESGTITITPNTINAGNFAATLTLHDEATEGGAEDVVINLSMRVKVVRNCDFTDDFNSVSANASYSSRQSTLGWTASNTAVVVKDDESYWMINGKTSTVGVITSPVYRYGIGELSLNYFYPNNENNGVKFKVEILDSNDNLVAGKSFTVTNSSAVKNNIYTETISDINVEGAFKIKITNLCPSNSTSNADRFAIGGLCWSKYGEPAEEEIFAQDETEEEVEAAMLPATTDVVVEKNKTLVVSAEKKLGDVTVKEGGKVVVNKPLKTNSFVLSAAPGQEAEACEVYGAENIAVPTGDIFMDFQLIPGDADMPNGIAGYWYSISAPFTVSVNDGIYMTDGTHLVNNTHIQVWEFAPQQYANGGRGWKRVNVMQRGKAYLIGFDPDAFAAMSKAVPNVVRLKATSLLADLANLVVEAFTGSARTYLYNGFSNPNTHNVRVSGSYQYYDNINQQFSTVTTDMVVGTPFFYAHSGVGTNDENLTINDPNATLAPTRIAGDEYKFCLQIRKPNSRYYDNQMYICASEDAASTFVGGKDVETMNDACSSKAAVIWTNAYGKRLAVENAPLVNNQALYDLSIMTPAAGTYVLRQANEVEGADLYVTYEGAIVWNLSLGDYEMDLVRGTTTGYGLLLVAQPNQMPTGVENGELLNGENGVQKILLNGQLYILRDGHLYDAVGKEMK